jgi:hypothetical protein
MPAKVIWIDVGTHFGQEYQAAFGSTRWMLYKWIRRFVGATVLQMQHVLSLRSLFQLMRSRCRLARQRGRFEVIFVEANSRLLSRSIYAQADQVFCLALGGIEAGACTLAPLFFAGGDEHGQGSSVFEQKQDVDPDHSTLVMQMCPVLFAETLKHQLDQRYGQYQVLLRINCEGSEDEIIYAFKGVFGDSMRDVLGSLKDVKEVKGDEAYERMMKFMDEHELSYTHFKSSILTWPQSLAKIESIAEECA